MHPGGHEDNVLTLKLERPASRGRLLRKQMTVYLGLTLILNKNKNKTKEVGSGRQKRRNVFAASRLRRGGGWSARAGGPPGEEERDEQKKLRPMK